MNSASFVAVVTSLLLMERGALHPSPPTERAKGQLREGFSYVAHEPKLLVPLIMMAIVGTLAYEFQVVLPLIARQTFHGGAPVFGFLNGAMGFGAVGGGLVTATRGKTGLRPLSIAAAAFGLMILVAAISPVLGLEIAALALVGWASVSFLATGNSTLQLQASPTMRGRVMALWAVAFLGSTPIGGPLIGWIISVSNGRVGLGVGGASCLVAAAIGFGVLSRFKRRAERRASSEPLGPGAVARPASA